VEFAKPDHGFTPHAGPFGGRSLEEMVQDPEGRAAVAEHIPHQGKGRQKLALAWLSWALQREVTLENLDEVERGQGSGNGAQAPQQPVNKLAVAATNHCLTGCAIGEVAGMAIATAAGWGNVTQTALAIALAYFFGFGLTALPLIRARLAPRTIVSTALAADTVSITIMEIIDNLTVILIPSALGAGLGDPLFYGSIAAGFAIAYPFAFLANRYLIARGRGHAVMHEHHAH
jgi:Domain of unknown function (DUF4396)